LRTPRDRAQHVGVDPLRTQDRDLDAVRVAKSSELAAALRRVLTHDGVGLVEVIVDSAVPLLYAHKN